MTQQPGMPGEGGHDEDAGPLVRLYAMTRGRTRHPRADFDLISIIMVAGTPPDARARLGPEHEAILRLCRRPRSVADISADLDLPLGVIRVLLGDLLDRQLIMVSKPPLAAEGPSEHVLREVIEGIRAL